jgi:hypothetical protein
VNCASYYEVLLKLRDAIHRKTPDQQAKRYCFVVRAAVFTLRAF